MKKVLFILGLALTICSYNVEAQNCNQGRELAKKTWEKYGLWKPNISLVPFKNKVKKIKRTWNWIASNGGSNIGPRLLEVDGGNEQGNITGQTKRTFVTPPSFNNSMVVTINKYDGRAETGVRICAQGKDGVTTELKDYTFRNSRNGANKSFVLRGVKGKIIIVAMKNRSIGNKFKYRINAK